MSTPEVEIRRSARRRKTVRGFTEAGKIIIEAPSHLSQAELDRAVESLIAKMGRLRPPPNDAVLHDRATLLFDRYLASQVGDERPAFRVRWVSNQQHRWGSCTPDTGAIRISDRVRAMPEYVQDYVLLHELTHLYERTHGPRFRRLMSVYPELATARSFLDGYTAGAGWETRDA